jgi:hypothetical protein
VGPLQAAAPGPLQTTAPNQRVRFLQPPELDALINAAPDDTLGSVERVLYLAAALTGYARASCSG